MPASRVKRARGNSHLYIVIPDLGAYEFTTTELSADFAETDRFAEVKSAPFNTTAGTIDVTSWDSGDWQQVVPDIHSGSMAVARHLILDATDVLKLIEANDQGKALAYLLVLGNKPASTAKNICVAGFARITGFNLETSDVHMLAMTLTIDGQPSFKQAATAFPTVAGVFA